MTFTIHILCISDFKRFRERGFRMTGVMEIDYCIELYSLCAPIHCVIANFGSGSSQN